ncbi:hypothetical protein Tco_0372992, partial [Tanacetum coccineum]
MLYPDKFLQIVASIEQYSDLDDMTLEEAIGRLKSYEERIRHKKGRWNGYLRKGRKKRSQNDKTGLGMEKQEKTKSKSKPKP